MAGLSELKKKRNPESPDPAEAEISPEGAIDPSLSSASAAPDPALSAPPLPVIAAVGPDIPLDPRLKPSADSPAALEGPADVGISGAPQVDKRSPDEAPPDIGESPVLPQVVSDAMHPATPTPTLAPRGQGFKHSLAQAFGFAAPDPRPGELARPEPNGMQKIGAALKLLGAVGNASAAGAGNFKPAELELEREKLGIQKTSADNEAAYRREMGDYYSGRNASAERIAQIKNEPQSLKNQIEALKNGQIVETGPDGKQTTRPLTQEELAQNPELAQKFELAKATIAEKNAATELAKARQDEIMNPNNPSFKQKADQIAANLKMAQQRVSVSLQGLGLREREFGMNYYGVDPNTGQSPNGTLLDANNHPVGNKFATNVRPTTTARGRAEQTHAIISAGDSLEKLIIDNADVLGPAMGRYGSLTQFAGTTDPRFARLRAALMSYAALHPAAHGARGINAIKAFEDAVGSPIQNPEALLGAIQGFKDTLPALEEVGDVHTVGGNNSGGIPGPIAAATRGNTGGGAGNTAVPLNVLRANGSKVLFHGQRGWSMSDGSIYSDADGSFLGKSTARK